MIRLKLAIDLMLQCTLFHLYLPLKNFISGGALSQSVLIS